MIPVVRRLTVLCTLVVLTFLGAVAPCSGTVSAKEGPRALVNDLAQTLDASLTAEQKALEGYKERLARAERERVYLTAASNGYQLQLSTFSNLLLSAGVDLSVLQKTRTDLKTTLLEIQKMTEDLKPAAGSLEGEKQNLAQQTELISRQILELSGLPDRNNTARKLEKTARQIQALLKEKEGMISRLDSIYQRHLEDLGKLDQAFSDLGTRLDAALEMRRAKNLFERQAQGFRVDALTALLDQGRQLVRQINRILSPEFWITGARALWQSAGASSLSIIVVLYGVLALAVRLRAVLHQEAVTVVALAVGPWTRLALDLACLSAIPGGLALTLFIYSTLGAMYPAAPLLMGGAVACLIFLGWRWADSALARYKGPDPAAPPALPKKLRGLFRAISLFGLVYLALFLLLGQESSLLALIRLTGALSLLVGSLVVWRDHRLLLRPDHETDTSRLESACKALLLFIGSVTLILDMTGYATLSFHWLFSWAKTAAIAFWWWTLMAMLRELDRYYREKSQAQRNDLLYDKYPVQWLLIRAGQLVWLITLTGALLLAWGSRHAVLDRVFDLLAHPITLGSMSFSLMGLIYGVLVILITYALTRIWKWLFQSKFLSRSGMEAGLQTSITTITIYVIWALGILVSLHVFGLNTASLAVAFGALGIGLGFGLQNIFNNFISGIILLFERPIQVGDDVEINGIWARVQRINVRSTVVQTYDNASLIIPNADFISTQVTNWSFKDKRIRRSINVGVAYGSDIARVRETLMEVAAKTPRVLKTPKPDVLFTDFGDSALMFRVRIWTDIDHMLTVETTIRSEIDRLFRERGIEISFPQRDIHIRSAQGLAPQKAAPVPEEIPPAGPAADPPPKG